MIFDKTNLLMFDNWFRLLYFYRGFEDWADLAA